MVYVEMIGGEGEGGESLSDRVFNWSFGLGMRAGRREGLS